MYIKNNKIGLNVLRVGLGLTIGEFANEIDASRGTVWKWCNKGMPRLVNRKICLKFGITPEICLDKELTEDEELRIFNCAEKYRLSEKEKRYKNSNKNNKTIDELLTEIKIRCSCDEEKLKTYANIITAILQLSDQLEG